MTSNSPHAPMPVSRRHFLRTAALWSAVCWLSPALAGQEDHERWMRRALEYGARNPRAPFGAVVVERATGKEVAWGVNHTVDGPIWHGEMDALQSCPRRNEGFFYSKLALYTTAEPCPMCQSAILWAGISLVVFGSSIKGLQAMGWDQIDLEAQEVNNRADFAKCEVVGGVLAAQCDETFRAALRLRKG